MKLPPGATGFNAPHEGEADLRAFTAVCHHAARDIGATVTAVTPAGVTPNYHEIDITHNQHQIAVLRHIALPFIALADARASGDLTVTFVNQHELATATRT